MDCGWHYDNDKKAGVKLLRGLPVNGNFLPKSKNCSRIRKTLYMYADIFEAGRENDLLEVGLQILVPSDERLKDPLGSISKALKNLKILFDKYNSSPEGMKDEYFIFFIDHIRLGLGKRGRENNIGAVPPAEPSISVEEINIPAIIAKQENIHGMSFHEVRFLNIENASPVKILISAIIISITLISPGILLLLEHKQNDRMPYYFLGIVLLMLSSVPVVTTSSMFLINKIKFIHLLGQSYFLRRNQNALSVVSYEGYCPICMGKVNLTKRWHQQGGQRYYTAVCQNYPKEHLYNFDHTTGIGREI